MLKAEVIAKLKSWGLDVDKLATAIKDEKEVDYELPEVQVFKPEELEARDANKVTEGKKLGESEGEKKGKELAAKALKKKFSIEDESKDLDKVVELVTTKAQTGDAGLKQQVELLIKDKETLQGQITTLQSEKKAATFDAQLISMFPQNRSGDLKDSERLMLAKMDLSFEELDGKTVVKRNGQVLRDSATQNPLEINKVITDYFAERKWVASTNTGGGRGGGDSTGGSGGGFKKLSEVEADWKKNNPEGNLVSPEFQAHLQAATKDVPDFDYYN